MPGTNTMRIGKALVHSKEKHYNKKLGRTIALGRAANTHTEVPVMVLTVENEERPSHNFINRCIDDMIVQYNEKGLVVPSFTRPE